MVSERQAARRVPGMPARPSPGGVIDVDPRRHLGVYAPPRRGKTTLLRGLALAVVMENPDADVVVIDTAQRGDWKGLGWPVTSDPDALGDPDAYRRVVWQPDLSAVEKPAKDGTDDWSRGWWYLWNVRAEIGEDGTPAAGSTVVIDEPADGVVAQVIPLIHLATRQGEGRNLALWWGSQNVLAIYWRLRANTLQRFAAPLPNAQERGILAADWGVEIPLAAAGDPWGTFYWNEAGGGLVGPATISQLLPPQAAADTLRIAEDQRKSGL